MNELVVLCVAAPSPRASLGRRMRTHGAVVGRRFRSVTKLTTTARIGRGYVWGRFLIAAAALKTPTRNSYNAQGVNLNLNDPLYALTSLRLFASSSSSGLRVNPKKG